jgi:polysaccharide biosynthesis transport protein
MSINEENQTALASVAASGREPRKPNTGYPAYSRYPAIQTEKNSVREYWRIIRKHQWMVLATLVVLVAIVTIGTLMSRPVYRAEAKIEIGKETERVLAGQRIMEVETANVFNPFYLQTQVDILRSRDIARRVIQRLNLGGHEDFKSKEFETLPENEKDVRIVNTFQGRYDVSVGRQSRVVSVSFDAYSPKLAAEVANSVAAEYITWSMESRLQGLGTTREFLTKRVSEAQDELRKSEESYSRYLTDRRIISLDERGNIALARTEELNRQLVELENERRTAEALYYRSRQVAAEELTPVISDPTVQALTRELGRLRQELANLSARYQPNYPAVRQIQDQVTQLEKQLVEARQRIVKNIETQYQVTRSRESDLRAALSQSKGETIQQNRESTELNLLKQKVETDRKNYEDMRLVQSAEVPIVPVKPNKLLNIGLSILIGLSLGIGMAFFVEYLNNTINTAEDIERYVQLPALGAIPSLQTLTRKRQKLLTGNRSPGEGTALALAQSELVSAHESVSTFSESYRALRTSLLLSSAEHAPKTMLVTSSHPAEGKTTIVANTAISLAQTGARVLVLDADMRRPRCHKILSLKNDLGLSTYLSREIAVDRVIQPHETPNLHVITAGPIPPNPSELLSSLKWRVLIAELEARYDHIVIDSPPVIHVTDALIISPYADGVVLVVKGGHTPREAVQRAKQALQDVNAKILGVVINGVNLHSESYYYYNYKYSYHQSE